MVINTSINATGVNTSRGGGTGGAPPTFNPSCSIIRTVFAAVVEIPSDASSRRCTTMSAYLRIGDVKWV